MPANQKIHGYTAYAHPLAQIEAAEAWHGFSSAMVTDEWDTFFTDAPPDEDEVPSVESIIGVLVRTKLRFESMGPNDEDDDGYWQTEYRGTRMDILLYGWAYQVQDALGIDSRLFWYGLFNTELIIVPDDEGVVAKARDLLKEVARSAAYVRERHQREEKYRTSLHQSWSKPINRGEGPREKNPAIVDRIALALRALEKALTPEEVAQAINHKNPASIAAALHQVVAYKKPKRLVGWIERDDHGRYRWAAETPGQRDRAV